MSLGNAKWVKSRYASKNANQQQRSSKVDVLGRGASGNSTDVLGRQTRGGSQKPNRSAVLGCK